MSEEEVTLDISESMDELRSILDDVFNKLAEFISNKRGISSLSDIVEIIELLVDLLRAIINAFIRGLPVPTKMIQFVIDIIGNLFDIILDNKDMIEGGILLVPAIPFIYLIYKSISSI